MADQAKHVGTVAKLIWLSTTTTVIAALLVPIGVTIYGEAYYCAELTGIMVAIAALCWWLWCRPVMATSLKRILIGWSLMTIVALSTLGNALEPGLTVQRIGFLLSILGLILAFGVVTPREYALNTLMLILGVTAILGLTGLLEYGFHRLTSYEGVFRASGITGNPNLLAGVMVIALPTMLAMRDTDRKHSLWWSTASVITGLSVAVSYSRTGFYIMCLLIGLFAILRERKLLVAMIVFGLLFGACFPGLYLRVGEGLQTLVGNPPSTLKQRVQLWSMCAIMFMNNPVLGVGLANYRSIQNQQILDFPHLDTGKRDLWPHNSLVWVAAELGILGLLPFCYVIVSLVLAVRERFAQIGKGGEDQSLKIAVALSLVAIIAYSMVDDVFLSVPISFTFWAIFVLYLRAGPCLTS